MRLVEVYGLADLTEAKKQQKFYHRTKEKLRKGAVLSSTSELNDFKGGRYNGTYWIERALEEKRREKYPDRPSRLNCVFLSMTLDSAFVDYGSAYEVEPLGEVFITDATTYSRLNAQFAYYNLAPDQKARLFKSPRLDEYWKGVPISDGPSIEALVKRARVIAPVKSADTIEVGDIVKGTIRVRGSVSDVRNTKKAIEQAKHELKSSNIKVTSVSAVTSKQVHMSVIVNAPWSGDVIETENSQRTGEIEALTVRIGGIAVYIPDNSESYRGNDLVGALKSGDITKS